MRAKEWYSTLSREWLEDKIYEIKLNVKKELWNRLHGVKSQNEDTVTRLGR